MQPDSQTVRAVPNDRELPGHLDGGGAAAGIAYPADDSPQDVAFLVRNHPVLLTDEGMKALREIMSNAESQGDTDMVKHLQARIETLEQLKAGG